MGRKKARFGDVRVSREAFERGDGRCANCHRPIGPNDQPTMVRSIDGSEPRLATMRCGRCSAMLTLHFDDTQAAAI